MWHRIVGWTCFVLSVACTDGLLGFNLSRASAQELKPTDEDRKVTRSVLEIIQQKHILAKDFDRRMASQALESYLNSLYALRGSL